MGELPDQLAQGFVHQELLMTLVFLCVSFWLASVCIIEALKNVNHAREQVCSLVFHQDLNVQDS